MDQPLADWFPRVALVYSFGDTAGSGVAALLESMVSWRPCAAQREGSRCLSSDDHGVVLAGFQEDVIYFSFLDKALDADAYIVLSRHSSASGAPTLSLHHPGNPGRRADHGGRPRELAWAAPRLAKALLSAYHREAEARGLLGEYKFTLEATHHGPTELARPIVFIEIGSRPENWSDKRAQEAMAEAVYSTVFEERSLPDCIPTVGVGGTHYPDKHTRLMLQKNHCYGHILAKYVFDELDEEIMVQAVEKSVDTTRRIVLLKAPSRVKRLVEKVAAVRGLEVEKYT